MTAAALEEPAINATTIDPKILEPHGGSAEGAPAEGKEPTTTKSRIVLYSVGVVAILCVILWLLIGRVEAYSYEADNDELQAQLNEKTKEIDRLKQKMEGLNAKLNGTIRELEGVNNRNAQLYVTIRSRDTTIEDLQGQLAQKQVENDALRATIDKLEGTITDLRRHISSQDDYISRLKDSIDQLYSDMRLVVGITNQELNRNQALEKRIEALDSEVQRHTQRIGELTWELLRTQENLQIAQYNKTLNWIGLQLAERQLNRTFFIEKLYSPNSTSCLSRQFYEIAKDKAPNLFLATEQDTGLIFGGYTEVNWTLDGDTDFYKPDPFAFTFSGTLQEKCNISNTSRAINTAHKWDNHDLMLSFGIRDITLFDQCLDNKVRHLVQRDKNYICPTVGPPNFYTNSTSPKLSSFEFYQVRYIP